MRSAKPVYHAFSLFWIAVFIHSTESQSELPYVRSVNLSAPETFVTSIFDEFGSNNSMNAKQFNVLLRELKIGTSSEEQNSDGGDSKVRAH